MNRAQRRAAESAARSERRNMTQDDYEKQLGNDPTGRELVQLRRASVALFSTAERGDPFGVREAVQRLAGNMIIVVSPVPTKWKGPLDPWELLRFVAENALFRFVMRDEFVAHLRTSGDAETARDLESGKLGTIPALICAHGEAFITFVEWRSN